MEKCMLVLQKKKVNIELPYDPNGSIGKEFTSNARDTGDMGTTPWLGRSPGGGNDNPLQYSHLKNPKTEEPGGLQSTGSQESVMTWQINHHQPPYGMLLNTTFHERKSWTQLSNYTQADTTDSVSGNISQSTENRHLDKKLYNHVHVHSSILHNSQNYSDVHRQMNR